MIHKTCMYFEVLPVLFLKERNVDLLIHIHIWVDLIEVKLLFKKSDSPLDDVVRPNFLLYI